ncbi:TIGR04149 family rSAM-modified RiPP [Macellibacteroides fermentans]|uniref:TIGR04149 family rSAM-modified RiPP n=1 Tax=Macellibacteroides fermentans TaxID=879969 RepID=UPI00406C21E6
MKKLEKLKLNYLSKNSLDERQKNALKGGSTCPCSCAACNCSSWDGSGSMPVSRSGNDMGMGSVNGNSASMRDSYL